MKFPQSLCVLLAVSMMAVMSACGGGSGNGSPGQRIPPPPPTGTNYTTCSGQQVPNWQSSLFKTPYQAAIAALVQHVGSASYAGKIGYIRVGLGKGGEINLPPGWDQPSSGACYGGYTGSWGYSAGSPGDSWNMYLESMVQYEGGLGSPYPLLVSITPITDVGTEVDDFLAPIAVNNGLSYGNQGLEASDISGFPNGCGGDWCNLFQSATPAIRELQTIGQSCPQGVGACSGQQGETGPLPPLLQFATGQGSPVVPVPSNDLEIYYQDWLIAYDPNNSLNQQYGASYASALQQASAHATMQVLFPDPTNSDIANFVLTQSDVTGVVIDVDWSDIQPTSSSSFDWTITDSSIQQWIAAGAKKVNIVFQNTTYGGGNSCPNSGIGSNGNAASNCAMPAWVWTALQ